MTDFEQLLQRGSVIRAAPVQVLVGGTERKARPLLQSCLIRNGFCINTARRGFEDRKENANMSRRPGLPPPNLRN